MNIMELKIEAQPLEELKEFYGDTLQLEIVNEEENTISFKIGSSRLTFQKTNQPTNYHFAINIPRNKIKESFEWLNEKVEIISDQGEKIIHFESWNAESVYFEDPAGNIVELIARHDLENAVSHEFSSDDFLCISEVGIASEDVLQDAEQMVNSLNLDYWLRRHSTFTTVGDQNGLVILVNTGRIWYMSDIEARQTPTEIIIEGEKEYTHQISPGIVIKSKVQERVPVKN